MLRKVSEFLIDTAISDGNDGPCCWNNPFRFLNPCTYTTAFCIRALRGVSPDERKKTVVGNAVKWLVRHVITHNSQEQGALPACGGEDDQADTRSTAICVYALYQANLAQDFPPLQNTISYLLRDELRDGEGLWRDQIGRKPGNLLSTTFALYALLTHDENLIKNDAISRAIEIIRDKRIGHSQVGQKARYWKSQKPDFDVELTAVTARVLLLVAQLRQQPASEEVHEAVRWLIDIQRESHVKWGLRAWGLDEDRTINGHPAAIDTIEVLELLKMYGRSVNYFMAAPFSFQGTYMIPSTNEASILCTCGNRVNHPIQKYYICRDCFKRLAFQLTHLDTS